MWTNVPAGGFEGALVQPKGEGSLDHVVILVLQRVHVERRPAAVGSKVGLDHRERSAGFFAGRLDRVGVAEERRGLAFRTQPDNTATSCLGHSQPPSVLQEAGPTLAPTLEILTIDRL